VFVALCGVVTACLVLHFQASGESQYYRVVEILALEHWHKTGQLLPDGASIFGDGCPPYGLISSAFPFARVGPYLSAEYISIAVRTADLCGFYLAARRLLDLGPGWATLAAVAFALGSSALMPASQTELVSLAFAPALAVLLQGAAEALRTGRRTQAIAYGSPAACLSAVWLLTAAYAACVFLLLLVVATLAYLVLTRRAMPGCSAGVRAPRWCHIDAPPPGLVGRTGARTAPATRSRSARDVGA
jgi:hypothetical protein